MQRSPCTCTTQHERRAPHDMQRVQVAFKTFGKLNADKSNVIVCVRPPAPTAPQRCESLSAEVPRRCVPALRVAS